jgi:hypothetical protein
MLNAAIGNADEIVERAGKLYDKFVGFIADLESVGDRLTQGQTSYREAMDKLAKRKRNLVRQAERVKELGAKTGKTIPQEFLDSEETQAVPNSPTGVETYPAEMVALKKMKLIRGIPLRYSYLGRQRTSPDRPDKVSRSNRLQNRF